MFQLSRNEYEILISQFVTSSWGGTRKLPYAFTELCSNAFKFIKKQTGHKS
jgi:hypothetical protein